MKKFITTIPKKDELILKLEAREAELWNELRSIKGNGYKANAKRRGLKGAMSACQQNISLHYDYLKLKQGLKKESVYK